MRWCWALAVVLGAMSSGSAVAAPTIAAAVPPLSTLEGPAGCLPSGCVQLAQMWPWSRQPAVDPMPADQRRLLARLLGRELEPVVSLEERQILSQALNRGERLRGDAVEELRTMLRERETLLQQQVAAAERAREAERQRDEQARLAAEAERRREEQAQLAAAAERQREAEKVRARPERVETAAALAARAEAEAERQRQAAVAERRRQAELAEAAAEAERRRQAEQERAVAEAKRQAEEAVRDAAESLVFYDELPPLQPL